MARYTVRPPTLEAEQWTGNLVAFQKTFPDAVEGEEGLVRVPILGDPEQFIDVPPEHWLTRDEIGGMQVFDDVTFHLTYQAVQPTP